jgi:hypothetical protein
MHARTNREEAGDEAHVEGRGQVIVVGHVQPAPEHGRVSVQQALVLALKLGERRLSVKLGCN